MVARDIMTAEVVTVQDQASIREAADLLLSKSYSALPVVNDAGELVGAISYHDLIRLVLPESLDEVDLSVLPTSAGFFPAPARAEALGDARVGEEMQSEELVSVPPGEPVAEIARLMVTQAARRVVVVENGKPIGVVAQGDIVRAIVHPRLGRPSPEPQ